VGLFALGVVGANEPAELFSLCFCRSTRLSGSCRCAALKVACILTDSSAGGLVSVVMRMLDSLQEPLQRGSAA